MFILSRIYPVEPLWGPKPTPPPPPPPPTHGRRLTCHMVQPVWSFFYYYRSAGSAWWSDLSLLLYSTWCCSRLTIRTERGAPQHTTRSAYLEKLYCMVYTLQQRRIREYTNYWRKVKEVINNGANRLVFGLKFFYIMFVLNVKRLFLRISKVLKIHFFC